MVALPIYSSPEPSYALLSNRRLLQDLRSLISSAVSVYDMTYIIRCTDSDLFLFCISKTRMIGYHAAEFSNFSNLNKNTSRLCDTIWFTTFTLNVIDDTNRITIHYCDLFV